MLGTPAIRNLIRGNKVAQMYSTIQTSQNMGMQTLDQNLTDLVRRNCHQCGRRRAVGKDSENFPDDVFPEGGFAPSPLGDNALTGGAALALVSLTLWARQL